MNCKKSTQAKVSQVRGNVLRVAVPLQKEITTLEDGRIEKRVEDFAPSPSYPTSVKLFNDTKLFSYTPEVNGNVVTFVDPGALPCGSYDIEIKCKDAQGQPMRFMGRSAVDIVEGTTDACIIAGVEFNAEMQTLLGAVFYAVGSGGGGTLTQVQADWDESDTTNAAYIRNKPTIPIVPTNVSAFANDAGYQSSQQVSVEINRELGNFRSIVNDALLGKVDKVAGKQLSTEDYTSAEKTKLAGLSNYDDTALKSAVNSLQSAIDAITSGDTTTAIKTFQEVIAFLDGVTDDATLIGKLNELRTLINAKYTKPSTGIPASDLESGVIPDVSGKQDTLVSGDNIKTVNGVSILGAGDIDTSQITYGKFDDNNRTAFLPAIAYNPITDTWIFGETHVTLASQMIYMDVTTDKHYMYVGRGLVEVGGVSGLATVATSGSYNDLKDKPTIPTVPSNVSAFTNDAGYLTQHQDISGKADKVTVVDVSSTGDVSQALVPNTFYRFGTIDSLALTLTSGTGFVMYAGKFTASSDWGGTQLSVPASVTEASGNDTVEAGKVYEFSILDNVISVKEVA